MRGPPDEKRPEPRERRPLGLAGGDGRPQSNQNPDQIQAHWQRLGDVTARIVERLRRLGPRPDLEAIVDVAGADLDGVLTRCSRLDPGIVEALHGERFPPLPAHKVSS